MIAALCRIGGISILLCGCASVRIYDQTSIAVLREINRPTKIVIRSFSTPRERFLIGKYGPELDWEMHNYRERLHRHLAIRLSKLVAPTTPIAANAPTPRGNYWLIEGTFDEVDKGNLWARSLVGFGLGRTSMATSVKVYDMSSTKPVLLTKFRTIGGSGTCPGIANCITPWVIMSNVLLTGESAAVFDTQRTARQIAAAVAELAYQQGIASDAPKPKR